MIVADFLINSTSFKPTDDVFCINIFMIDDEEFESLIPENFTLKLVIDDIHVTIEPDTTYISITDNEGKTLVMNSGSYSNIYN